MHPEIMRNLVAQHTYELREQAHQAALARTAGRARRAGRRGAARTAAGDPAGTVIPAVPDYVDGSFRTAGDETPSVLPGARRAA